MAFDYTKLFSISGLVLLIGIIFTILAIRTKGKIMNIAKGWVVAGLLIISGVGLYGTGVTSDYGFGSKTLAVGDETPQIPPVQNPPVQNQLVNQIQPTSDVTSQPGDKQRVVGGRICREQADGTNSLDTDVRNKENSSLSYLAPSISAESDSGTTLDTGTATGGSSLAYVTLNVPACQEGTIYSLVTTGLGVAPAKVRFSSFETTTKNEILTSASNVVGIQARDSTLAAQSNGNSTGPTGGGSYVVSGTGTADSTARYTNTSVTASGSINGVLDFTVNGTTTSFGAYGMDDGALISYDSGTASLFSRDSFTLSDTSGVGLKKVECPATIVANRNAEACWQMRTLKASDGEIRLKFKLSADLGEPIASTVTPTVCIDDKVYFRDTNGKIAYDFFSSSGTNQGVGGTCITFPMS